MRTLRPAAFYTYIAGERLALDVSVLTRACYVIPAIPRCGWTESRSPNLGVQYYRVVEIVSRKNSKLTTKSLGPRVEIVYIL